MSGARLWVYHLTYYSIATAKISDIATPLWQVRNKARHDELLLSNRHCFAPNSLYPALRTVVVKLAGTWRWEITCLSRALGVQNLGRIAINTLYLVSP